MNHRVSRIICLGLPVLALAAAAAINAGFDNRRHSVAVEMQREQEDWRDQAAARKHATETEAQQRAARNEAQLEEALGGPINAAWKNPDFDISQMLQATAAACAPKGTMVKVHVDRFTEFELFLVLPSDAHPPIAELCLNLLRHCARYLSAVHIIQGSRAIADLDDRTIGSAPDWSGVTVPQMQELLDASRAADSPEAESAKTPSAVDPNEVPGTPDGRGEKAALLAFNAALQEQINHLNTALKVQGQAADFKDVRTGADLQSKLDTLETNESVLADAWNFFLNEDKEFRRQMEQQPLDSLLVDILCRKSTQIQEQRRPYVERLFQSIDERERTVREFIKGMQRISGDWSLEPPSTVIHFTNQDARDTYERLTDQMRKATVELSAAMKEWGRWEHERKGD